MLQTWLHALPFLLGAGFLTWLVSVQLRNVTIVDTLWSLMFVIAAFSYAASTLPPGPRAQLVLVLVTVWGLRLAIYLGRRNFGHEEDRRYQKIRRRNEPGFAWKSLYLVFGLQALLAWVISLPLLGAIAGDAESPGLARLRGCRALPGRLVLRGRRRLATYPFQGESGQCRAGDGPGAVGPHAPSQLFR